jgi:hypothetical protein
MESFLIEAIIGKLDQLEGSLNVTRTKKNIGLHVRKSVEK